MVGKQGGSTRAGSRPSASTTRVTLWWIDRPRRGPRSARAPLYIVRRHRSVQGIARNPPSICIIDHSSDSRLERLAVLILDLCGDLSATLTELWIGNRPTFLAHSRLGPLDCQSQRSLGLSPNGRSRPIADIHRISAPPNPLEFVVPTMAKNS